MHVLDGNPPADVRANTVIELIELSGLVQDRVGFERWRRELEGQRDKLPPDQLADYETKVGSVLAIFDRPSEAREHFEVAIQVAESYGLSQRLFDAERMLRELRDETTASAAGAPALEPPLVPEIRETVESLFALRSGG